MGRVRQAGLEQLWRQRMRRFAEWPGSVREFCRREQVTVNQFYYWRKRLQRDVRDERQSGIAGSGDLFVPVAVPAELSQSSIKICLPNGCLVNLPADIAADRLAASITAAGQLRHGEARPC